MNEQITEILRNIQDLEERLEREFEKRRAVYDIYVKNKLTDLLQKEIVLRHRRLRQNLFTFLKTSSFLNYMVAPVIYSMIVPIMAIDLWATIYQHLCFRVYKIPRVQRSAYIVIDREHLAYLNAVEKLNCVYCGYGNGVIAYVREIASRTEQYWCPITHARRIADPHQRYLKFLEYGDAEGYRNKLKNYRKDAQQP